MLKMHEKTRADADDGDEKFHSNGNANGNGNGNGHASSYEYAHVNGSSANIGVVRVQPSPVDNTVSSPSSTPGFSFLSSFFLLVFLSFSHILFGVVYSLFPSSLLVLQTVSQQPILYFSFIFSFRAFTFLCGILFALWIIWKQKRRNAKQMKENKRKSRHNNSSSSSSSDQPSSFCSRLSCFFCSFLRRLLLLTDISVWTCLCVSFTGLSSITLYIPDLSLHYSVLFLLFSVQSFLLGFCLVLLDNIFAVWFDFYTKIDANNPRSKCFYIFLCVVSITLPLLRYFGAALSPLILSEVMPGTKRLVTSSKDEEVVFYDPLTDSDLKSNSAWRNVYSAVGMAHFPFILWCILYALIHDFDLPYFFRRISLAFEHCFLRICPFFLRCSCAFCAFDARYYQHIDGAAKVSESSRSETGTRRDSLQTKVSDTNGKIEMIKSNARQMIEEEMVHDNQREEWYDDEEVVLDIAFDGTAVERGIDGIPTLPPAVLTTPRSLKLGNSISIGVMDSETVTSPIANGSSSAISSASSLSLSSGSSSTLVAAPGLAPPQNRRNVARRTSFDPELLPATDTPKRPAQRVIKKDEKPRFPLGFAFAERIRTYSQNPNQTVPHTQVHQASAIQTDDTPRLNGSPSDPPYQSQPTALSSSYMLSHHSTSLSALPSGGFIFLIVVFALMIDGLSNGYLNYLYEYELDSFIIQMTHALALRILAFAYFASAVGKFLSAILTLLPFDSFASKFFSSSYLLYFFLIIAIFSVLIILLFRNSLTLLFVAAGCFSAALAAIQPLVMRWLVRKVARETDEQQQDDTQEEDVEDDADVDDADEEKKEADKEKDDDEKDEADEKDGEVDEDELENESNDHEAILALATRLNRSSSAAMPVPHSHRHSTPSVVASGNAGLNLNSSFDVDQLLWVRAMSSYGSTWWFVLSSCMGDSILSLLLGASFTIEDGSNGGITMQLITILGCLLAAIIFATILGAFGGKKRKSTQQLGTATASATATSS